MSGKSIISNTNCDAQQWGKTPSLDASVKLAGEEAKDRLYEPKHKKKAVRVLTVVAYVFFVSLAAIMLSLYYVFLWDGTRSDNNNGFLRHDDAEICNALYEGVAERLETAVNFTTVLPPQPAAPIQKSNIEKQFTTESTPPLASTVKKEEFLLEDDIDNMDDDEDPSHFGHNRDRSLPPLPEKLIGHSLFVKKLLYRRQFDVGDIMRDSNDIENRN